MSEKELVARRGNILLDAAYAPGSLRRMRLLLIAISQIDEELTHKTDVSVSAVGMGDMFDGPYKDGMGGSFYQELARAAEDLMDMKVTTYVNPDKSHRPPHRRVINVVSECNYLENEGRVVMRFTDGIIPFLVDMRHGYQKVILSKVLGMKSSYGIRFYELLRRWSTPKGMKKVTVGEFRRLMGVKDGEYRRLGNLKAKVLYPAMEDVNERSDWGVRFGQIKSGRTVVMFQFWMWEKGEKKKETAQAATPVDRLPDGTIPMPTDFKAYSKKVLAISQLGQQVRNTQEGEQALKAELAEGTIRDTEIGKIIQREWKPVKAE